MSLIFQKLVFNSLMGVMASPDTTGVFASKNMLTFWDILQTVGALALVLVLIWGTLWAFRRVTGSKFTNPSGMRIIGGIALGTRRSIQMVMIADKLYILGLTDSNISLIDKIDDPDEIAKILPNISNSGGGDIPFAKIMQRIKNQSPETKE